eukprot:8257889-Ditylum_brightwellii.AAC.1
MALEQWQPPFAAIAANFDPLPQLMIFWSGIHPLLSATAMSPHLKKRHPCWAERGDHWQEIHDK